MTKRNKRGFTLIELLVVVAILGLLATIVAVSLTSARARARDARRVSDVRQLELALELYYAAHEEYPDAVVSAGEDIAELAGQGFLNMSSFPTDPNSGKIYCYAVGTDASLASGKQRQYYHIGAQLENTNSDLLGQDVDYASSTTGVVWTNNEVGGSPLTTDCTFVAAPNAYIDGDSDATDAIYDRGVFPR